ncbi:hypothetical protein [Flavobacterium sp. N502540]|nr:hypothetical protein [Flavobacterium sp. N502540]
MIKFVVTVILILIGFICKVMIIEIKNTVSASALTELILKR